MSAYIVGMFIVLITLGLMYGEARYAHGRIDFANELIEKYENEERPK